MATLMIKRISLVAGWIAASASVSVALSSVDTEAGGTDLDATIELLRCEWNVPGVAVGVVKDGEVVYLKGFGLRDVQAELPFTPDTLLRVASTTKSITSALVGQFVDEGVVEWTTPVREYYPEFQMVDPVATEHTTFEDMLCHRTGLPMTENLLATGVGRELTGSPRGYRENLLRRLRHFDPSQPFRARWQYQDLMVTCVGGILEWITGTNYNTLARERLLEPIGMINSTFSFQEAKASGQMAQPYAEVDGKVESMNHIDVTYLAPAAGLYSNAREMLRWVQFNLDRGRVGDRQLVSEESMEWIHSPHAIMDEAWARELWKSNDVAYAHGWVRVSHLGHPMLIHGGSFNGHRTTMLFMPDQNIGVIVHCNLNGTFFDYAIGRTVLDHFLGIDSAEEWCRDVGAFQAAGEEGIRAAEEQHRDGRSTENRPQHDLAAYAGTYSHPGYGAFIIENGPDGLMQTYDGRSFPVTPYDGDTFETRFQSTENSLLYLTITFLSDTEGDVVAMTTSLIPDLPPQRFVRE